MPLEQGSRRGSAQGQGFGRGCRLRPASSKVGDDLRILSGAVVYTLFASGEKRGVGQVRGGYFGFPRVEVSTCTVNDHSHHGIQSILFHQTTELGRV